MLDNIPGELRALPQWVAAGTDKRPVNPHTGGAADVTDAATWGTFEQARATDCAYVGFVLTEKDPYCIIDLDNKPGNPPTEDEERVHKAILANFDTYAERSVSGHGYHVILKGHLGNGRRRGNVEVYDRARYMICTGNVSHEEPIVQCQELLDALVSHMPRATPAMQGVDAEEEVSDATIHARACAAANGDKYMALCDGRWEALGYPSQSEADHALLSLLCFYSPNNAQVRRIFRCTALGKRRKAQRDAYLNYGISLFRGEQASQKASLDELQGDVDTWLAALPKKSAPAPAAPASSAPTTSKERTVDLPPGLVGELARYIHASSVRPVQEVSLAASLGLLAGILGRSYNISGTGLNQYLLVLATTGTGKEDGPRGVERIIHAVRNKVPMAEDFIGPGMFASGQALIRVLDAKPCFVSLLGEFGLTLQALNDPRAPSSTLMLRRVLLDLYAKSGWKNVLHSTAYSDAEKNTRSVQAPNMTLLGDATPETFYAALGMGDIADGLLPRLHVMEYKGQRPARNKHAGAPPPPALVDAVADAAALALTTASNNTCGTVRIDPRALQALDAYDARCDQLIRDASEPLTAQLWNRAHLKALKLAGLVAVGCNMHDPVVTLEVAQWATAFVDRGVEDLLARWNSGDVGVGHSRQVADVRRMVEEYFALDVAKLRHYKEPPQMQKMGLVTYSYLGKRAYNYPSIKRDTRGAKRAFCDALDHLVDTEQLVEIDAAEVYTKFRRRTRTFAKGPAWK